MKQLGVLGDTLPSIFPFSCYISEIVSPGIVCLIVQVVKVKLVKINGFSKGVLKVRDGSYNEKIRCCEHDARDHCRYFHAGQGLNIIVLNPACLNPIKEGSFYKLSNVHVVAASSQNKFLWIKIDSETVFPYLVKPFHRILNKRKRLIKNALKKKYTEKLKDDIVLFYGIGVEDCDPPFSWDKDYLPLKKQCNKCKTWCNFNVGECINHCNESELKVEFFFSFMLITVCSEVRVIALGKEAEHFFGISSENVISNDKGKEYIRCFVLSLLVQHPLTIQINLRAEKDSGIYYIVDTSLRFPTLPDFTNM